MWACHYRDRWLASLLTRTCVNRPWWIKGATYLRSDTGCHPVHILHQISTRLKKNLNSDLTALGHCEILSQTSICLVSKSQGMKSFIENCLKYLFSYISSRMIINLHISPECGTRYHHPRRQQCVLNRNLSTLNVATCHYWCRHHRKDNCIWDNLLCCLIFCN